VSKCRGTRSPGASSPGGRRAGRRRSPTVHNTLLTKVIDCIEVFKERVVIVRVVGKSREVLRLWFPVASRTVRFAAIGGCTRASAGTT
jgi:hypothetical protein